MTVTDVKSKFHTLIDNDEDVDFLEMLMGIVDAERNRKKEDIANSLKIKFPNVKAIRLWIGDIYEDYPHHPIIFWEIKIRGDWEEWKRVFEEKHITLILDYHGKKASETP